MSVPSIQQQAQRGRAFHGQHTYITETIPVLSDAALNLEGDRNPNSKNRQVWVSHSWGGVLMTSAYVRFPALLDRIACQAHFGTKRCISQIWSWEYFMRVALGWNFLCPLMGRFYGYVPCKKVSSCILLMSLLVLNHFIELCLSSSSSYNYYNSP